MSFLHTILFMFPPSQLLLIFLLSNNKTEMQKQQQMKQKAHKNTTEFVLYWPTPAGLGHVLERADTLSEIPLDKADSL